MDPKIIRIQSTTSGCAVDRSRLRDYEAFFREVVVYGEREKDPCDVEIEIYPCGTSQEEVESERWRFRGRYRSYEEMFAALERYFEAPVKAWPKCPRTDDPVPPLEGTTDEQSDVMARALRRAIERGTFPLPSGAWFEVVTYDYKAGSRDLWQKLINAQNSERSQEEYALDVSLWAIRVESSGRDSPSLRRLADLEETGAWSEAEPLLKEAFAELGIPFPTAGRYLELQARFMAEDILARRTSAEDGCRALYQLFVKMNEPELRVEWSALVDVWTHAKHETSGTVDDAEERIRAASLRVLDALPPPEPLTLY